MAPVLDLSAHSVRLARPVVSFDQAREIAEEHGTPTLVISRSTVRRNYEAMRAARGHHASEAIVRNGAHGGVIVDRRKVGEEIKFQPVLDPDRRHEIDEPLFLHEEDWNIGFLGGHVFDAVGVASLDAIDLFFGKIQIHLSIALLLRIFSWRRITP